MGGPEGSIPLDVLSATGDLQQAVVRLAKGIEDRAGRRGRSPLSLEQLTRLSAVEIRSGSAVLVIEAPAEKSAPFPQMDLGLQALSALEDALEDVAQGREISAKVDKWSRISLATFFERVSAYSSVEVTDIRGPSQRRTVEVEPMAASARFSVLSETGEEPESFAAVGRLYAVDIKNHQYRLQDDLGRSVSFAFPEDSEHLGEIRGLVGSRVEVVGVGRVDNAGVVHDFEVDSIEPFRTMTANSFAAFDLADAIGSAVPVVDLEELRLADLTDEESAEFWSALNS